MVWSIRHSRTSHERHSPFSLPETLIYELIWSTQVYNSWWNGYLLGYPERFVDSYCRDLTSELNSTIVESQIEAARRDAIAFLGRNK